MPGKGAYWKKGGLIDETVKEEDLSQALQSKVNAVGGGGAWTKIGDVIVSSPTTSVDLGIATQAFSSYNYIKIFADIFLSANGDTAGIFMNNTTGASYQIRGMTIAGGGFNSIFTNNSVIGSGQTLNANVTPHIHIEASIASEPATVDEAMGFWEEGRSGDTTNNEWQTGHYKNQTGSPSGITAIGMKTGGSASITAGSRLSAYIIT